MYIILLYELSSFFHTMSVLVHFALEQMYICLICSLLVCTNSGPLYLCTQEHVLFYKVFLNMTEVN